MTLIIAARFPTFDAAHAAAQRLMQAGVPESALHVFFVNPPGAHDHYAVGGDQAADPGTRGASNKALGMAALLGAIGAVAGGGSSCPPSPRVSSRSSLVPAWLSRGIGGWLDLRLRGRVGCMDGRLRRDLRIGLHLDVIVDRADSSDVA